MVTYSAVARVSRSASTGPPGSTLGLNADHGHPPLNSAPLGINRLGAVHPRPCRDSLVCGEGSSAEWCNSWSPELGVELSFPRLSSFRRARHGHLSNASLRRFAPDRVKRPS